MSETSGQVDEFLREAMIAATGGIDLQRGVSALQDMFDAVAEQMRVLKGAKYESHDVKTQCPKCSKRFVVEVPEPNAEVIARAAANTAKAGDTMYRLMEFAKGKPDSRVDAGAGWLQVLSAEQFAQVQRWVGEAEGRK